MVLLAYISHLGFGINCFFVKQFHVTSQEEKQKQIPKNSLNKLTGIYRKIGLVRLQTPLSPLSEVLRF